MPNTTKRKILIVDDNVDAADTLCDLFQIMGHYAFTANSGVEALDLVETLKPEIAFLDIGMPNMDGFALAGALRARPELDKTLLVALTGYGQPEDVARALAAGFDHHMIKPPDMDELDRILLMPR